MKKSGGSKKIGRSKKACEIYAKLGIRERNKKWRVTRHLKTHPTDRVATGWLKQN